MRAPWCEQNVPAASTPKHRQSVDWAAEVGEVVADNMCPCRCENTNEKQEPGSNHGVLQIASWVCPLNFQSSHMRGTQGSAAGEGSTLKGCYAVPS